MGTPTWEVYMVAIIETWAGFEEVSPTASGAIPGQLTINEERYSYYEIPFRISFPQQITLVAPPIRVAAPMVTLYAVIEQEIQDINFSPGDGENFGTVELTIKTQTQYPFGLRNFTDPVAPALIRTISGDIQGDPEWISADNPEVCTVVDGSEDNYLCEQEWTILITPNLCDVSGQYQMEFWAICFTDVDGCALDANAPSQDSNTWTGYLDFTVEAQNFCPQIVDEITVEAYISKFAESTYTVEAIPGENVFSNDYVWFEVTYATRSLKSGYDFEDGDDSLIESVRPTRITMTVSMSTAPLQFEVNRENGDVTGTDLEYTVLLCEVDSAVFPYNGELDDCFDDEFKGWNALNYLDFQESVNNVGANQIDLNEIGFSLRLDERVIPVDLPNDAAVITIDVESEVYYHGNFNPPGRRHMEFTVRPQRRKLQEIDGEVSDIHLQKSLVSDVFPLTGRSGLSWCSLNADKEATFKLDISMDPLQIPDVRSVIEDTRSLELQLTQHFRTQLNNIDVLRANQCSDSECTLLWDKDTGRAQGTKDAVRYMQYFIHVPQVSLAQQLQDELYNGGGIYHTEWFSPTDQSPKRLRYFEIDQCAGDYGLETQQDTVELKHQIDDGASHLMVVMVLLATAFMF